MFDNFVQTDADKSRDVRNALNQWFPTFFDAFLPWLILELFIPPLLHKFNRVAEKAKTSFLWWLRSHVVGWSIILVAMLRPFNKPLLYDN